LLPKLRKIKCGKKIKRIFLFNLFIYLKHFVWIVYLFVFFDSSVSHFLFPSLCSQFHNFWITYCCRFLSFPPTQKRTYRKDSPQYSHLGLKQPLNTHINIIIIYINIMSSNNSCVYLEIADINVKTIYCLPLSLLFQIVCFMSSLVIDFLHTSCQERTSALLL